MSTKMILILLTLAAVQAGKPFSACAQNDIEAGANRVGQRLGVSKESDAAGARMPGLVGARSGGEPVREMVYYLNNVSIAP